MLTNLSIKNYALIENLTVQFEDKLSIITGETGAGKSILLGALGLVLGNRADSSTLKNKEQKCIIEAEFDIKNYQLQDFFDDKDIDYEQNTIIRREILPSGKSRSFINDTPTTLTVLQELSVVLIDVHSQHQSLKLSDKEFQFQLIDSLAGNYEILDRYKAKLLRYQMLSTELRKKKMKHEIAQQQYQYNLHMLKELEAAKIVVDEQEQIEQSLDKLNNVETIKLNLAHALELIAREEHGLRDLLNKVSSNMEKIGGFSNEYQALFSRLNSMRIELDDIVSELEQQNENVSSDPLALDALNSRLQLLFDLQKKHLVRSNGELLKIQYQLSENIQEIEQSEERFAAMETELNILATELDKLAVLLNDRRQNTVPDLLEKLQFILSNLGMGNSRFKLDLGFAESYFSNGKNTLEFQLSADKGNSYGPLKKIASGGELSRIMLATKAIISENLKLPTIIFDEIDAGVSGNIAQKMADILLKMSENMQVIAISHIPQIASKGMHHYKVYKEESGPNIVTQLKKLSYDERISEIAEMLSGKNATSTAIDHAKQLLS